MGDKDFDIKLSERVTKLETEMGVVKKEVEILGTIEKAITKMSTLMEVQAESITAIHSKVDNLEDKINCNEEKSKIDVITIVKDVFINKIIPLGITAYVTYMMLNK